MAGARRQRAEVCRVFNKFVGSAVAADNVVFWWMTGVILRCARWCLSLLDCNPRLQKLGFYGLQPLQPAVAKVVELLVPHQSQRAMLVPRPLETRRRPTAQNATALLVCHLRKSPPTRNPFLGAALRHPCLNCLMPAQRTYAAPKGNWCSL